jgi:hypothetical protein
MALTVAIVALTVPAAHRGLFNHVRNRWINDGYCSPTAVPTSRAFAAAAPPAPATAEAPYHATTVQGFASDWMPVWLSAAARAFALLSSVLALPSVKPISSLPAAVRADRSQARYSAPLLHCGPCPGKKPLAVNPHSIKSQPLGPTCTPGIPIRGSPTLGICGGSSHRSNQPWLQLSWLLTALKSSLPPGYQPKLLDD